MTLVSGCIRFIRILADRDDHGNGIPIGNGNPMGMGQKLYQPWGFGWEWETMSMGMGMTHIPMVINSH